MKCEFEDEIAHQFHSHFVLIHQFTFDGNLDPRVPF